MRFGDSDYQFELRQEIDSRTQGLDEPVADYLTCIRTLLRRLSPPLTEEEQVSYAHRNMLPKLQLTIHRSEIVSVDHLEQLAIQLEKGHRASRSYSPPPPPERALLPGLAYRDPRRSTRGTRLAMLNVMEATDEDITELPIDELHFTPSLSASHPARVKQAVSGNNPNGHEKAGNKNKTRNHPSPTPESTRNTQEPDTPGNPFYTPTRPTRNSAACNKPRQPEEETVCWNCHDLRHWFNRFQGLLRGNSENKGTIFLSSVNRPTEQPDSGPLIFMTLFVKGKALRVMINSGSNRSFMGQPGIDLVSGLGIPIQNIQTALVNSAFGQLAVVNEMVEVPISSKGNTRNIKVRLLPALHLQSAFGTDFLHCFGLVTDFVNYSLNFASNPENSFSFEPEYPSRYSVTNCHALVPLTDKQSASLTSFIERNIAPVPDYLPATNLTDHKIEVGNNPPIKNATD